MWVKVQFKFLQICQLHNLEKRLLCVNDDEKDALEYILSEFFIKTNTGYFNLRCDTEIIKFRANISAKAKAGIASAEARKAKTTHVEHMNNTRTTDEQQTKNQEPITNNQETNKKPRKKTALVYDDYPDFLDFWSAYPKSDGKKEALKSWHEKNPPIDKVLQALAWQNIGYAKIETRFIPNASTYINQERWHDEQPMERAAF